MVFALAAGFAGVYAATGGALAAVMCSNTAAYFVLLAPLPVERGRTNALSALFRQPVALSEQARGDVSIEHVTPTHRRAALLLVVTQFALAFTGLGVGVASL